MISAYLMTNSNDNKKATKRQTCPQCLRPIKTCICKLVQPIQNDIELIILQHPLEVNEAKNTARLLHLCLKNSQIHVGETFTDAFFAQLNVPPAYNLLLYPETPEEKSLGIISPPQLDTTQLCNDDSANHKNLLRLWVLDATWRKSRKMLYLNPHLQRMPRIILQDAPASIYKIRKAHSENQLSTLEASCYALRQLEQNRVDYSPVLTAFAGFIKQHNTFIPPP